MLVQDAVLGKLPLLGRADAMVPARAVIIGNESRRTAAWEVGPALYVTNMFVATSN